MDSIMDRNEKTIQDFVSLLTSHQSKIYSYILTLVVNYSDAADIMQETSSFMWSKFSDFEIGTDFLAWSLSVAHYRILEHRRKIMKSKEVRLSDDVFIKIAAIAKDRQDKSSEYLSYLKKCFNLLKQEDKRIILLRYHENLKVKDIAERFGNSVQCIYRNISRIQESLLRCIKRKSFEMEGGHV